MKLVLPAVLAVLFVSACDWSEDRQQAAADFLVGEIQAANAEGFDPINFDDDELAMLARGCRFVDVFYPEYAADAAKVCQVVQEAAK